MFAFLLLQYWKLVFHIVKKLGLEKFITATQTTVAKNDIGFPTASSSPSFRLMRKLAIQDGLNPLIHGAERCSRNWSDWKQKVEGNSETQFISPAQQWACWLIYDQKPPNSNWTQNKLAREATQSWLVLKVCEQTEMFRSFSILLNS